MWEVQLSTYILLYTCFLSPSSKAHDHISQNVELSDVLNGSRREAHIYWAASSKVSAEARDSTDRDFQQGVPHDPAGSLGFRLRVSGNIPEQKSSEATWTFWSFCKWRSYVWLHLRPLMQVSNTQIIQRGWIRGNWTCLNMKRIAAHPTASDWCGAPVIWPLCACCQGHRH